VAIRQICEAARRAAIAAPALKPAYKPVHSNFRNMDVKLPTTERSKP
jgi:hypothetical protein